MIIREQEASAHGARLTRAIAIVARIWLMTIAILVTPVAVIALFEALR